MARESVDTQTPVKQETLSSDGGNPLHSMHGKDVKNITYILLWWSAVSHHLLKANVSRILIKTRTRTYLLGLPGYLLAMLCAFWNPFASVGICSVLWLFWAVASYEREPLLFVHTQATKGTTQ